MDARTSKRQKRISNKQERRMAEDLGGRVQPASGAMKSAKGDVRVIGKVRGEAKYTAKDTYSLKLSDLEKIVGEAGLERAVLQLCFIDRANKPVSSFAIYPGMPGTEIAPQFPQKWMQSTGKSILLSRDRLALSTLSNKKAWILFLDLKASAGQRWFAVQEWADYLASMEEDDA